MTIEKRSLLIAGPTGLLEMCISIPKDSQGFTMIICHPHSLQGGTMNNKVVTTVEKACLELGCKVIRFNFRGVGQSEGVYDDGQGEVQDVSTIIDWAQNHFLSDRIFLVGFSFGSFVAYQASLSHSISGLCLIAPPIHHYEYPSSIPPCAWSVIIGDKDELVPLDAVIEWLKTKPNQNYQFQIFKDTTHFFHGKLIELKDYIQSYFGSLMKSL